MTTHLTDHLTAYARDQLAVISGWQGTAYVERCLALWEQEYGSGVSASVRAALGDSLSRHGRR